MEKEKTKNIFNEVFPLEEIIYTLDVKAAKKKERYELEYYYPETNKKEKIIIEEPIFNDEKEKEIEQAIVTKNIWIIYGYIVRPIKKLIRKNKIEILNINKKNSAQKIHLNNLLTIRKIKALEIINKKIKLIRQSLASNSILKIGALTDQIIKLRDSKKELISTLLFLEYAKKQIRKLDIEKIIF